MIALNTGPVTISYVCRFGVNHSQWYEAMCLGGAHNVVLHAKLEQVLIQKTASSCQESAEVQTFIPDNDIYFIAHVLLLLAHNTLFILIL